MRNSEERLQDEEKLSPAQPGIGASLFENSLS
jgi:hypothetical protein